MIIQLTKIGADVKFRVEAENDAEATDLSQLIVEAAKTGIEAGLQEMTRRGYAGAIIEDTPDTQKYQFKRRRARKVKAAAQEPPKK